MTAPTRARMTVAAVAALAAMGAASKGKSAKLTEASAMEYPSYAPTEHAPTVGLDEWALRVRAGTKDGRVVFRKDQPWPLFGAFRVGRDVLDEFGDDPVPHVLIAVFHKQSYGAWYGSARRAEQAPSPAGQEPGSRAAAASGTFAVDLKAQCGVRPAPGKYWAVALLGKLASNVVEFEVK